MPRVSAGGRPGRSAGGRRLAAIRSRASSPEAKARLHGGPDARTRSASSFPGAGASRPGVQARIIRKFTSAPRREAGSDGHGAHWDRTGLGVNYRMKAFVVAGLLFAFVRANAEDMRLTLDPVATHVKFILPDVLHTVHGEFTLKSGAIEFDPVTARASGAIVVDAASGESGSRGRDSRMHKNILESAMFPEITFVPDRVDGV